MMIASQFTKTKSSKANFGTSEERRQHNTLNMGGATGFALSFSISQSQRNQMMQSKKTFYYWHIFTSMLILVLSACSSAPSTPENSVITLPPTLTLQPQRTNTSSPDSSDTPQPVCTPPPCAANEAYFCPDECPGGCGTTCATHTPVNTEAQPTDTPTPSANVQNFPNPGDYQWISVAEGLSNPIGIVQAGDGSNRLFILEQEGTIRILQNGQLLPAPFLDIRSQVNSGPNEAGLLGLAFHPNYTENGVFFINYSDNNRNSVVSRLAVSSDPNVADPNSENIILQIRQPFPNHNGGHLLFGPDGYLYIGFGDGGSSGDPEGNGQNSSTLLGSMLRLDVDNGSPYAIPPDNPYVNGGGLPEVWAMGLRNPWRYSFDRLTGDLYIGDVGQNQWEEIHLWEAGSPNGANFGWNFWEGLHPYQGTPPEDTAFEFPIWEYAHDQGCSVTGGYVYRGSMPEWQGIYFYGDFCSGNIWGLLRDMNNTWQNTLLFDTDFLIASFGEDEAGEIYLANRAGSIYQLTKK
jgi:glucose/arabinose dehydrogenase